MKAKSMILILIALGCGLIASIGVSQVMVKKGDGNKQDKIKTQEVLVAMKLIDIANPLDEENVKVEEWPEELVPEGAIGNLEDVGELVARSRVIKGQVIVNDLLATKDDVAKLDIPSGYRVMAINVAAAEVVEGMVQPGDRVDITGYFRGGNGGNISKTFLHDVQVYSVSGNREKIIDPDGRVKAAKTVALLIKPDQVEKLLFAKRVGSLTLSLRSYDDVEPTQSREGTRLEDILGDPSQTADDEPRMVAEDEPEQEQSGEPNTFTEFVSQFNPGTAPPMLAVQQQKMTIITPDGIKEYTWSDPNGLPEVSNVSGGLGAALAPALPSVPAITTPVSEPGGNDNPKPESSTPEDE